MVHSLETGKQLYKFSDMRSTANPVVIPSRREVVSTEKGNHARVVQSTSLSDPEKVKDRTEISDVMTGMAFSPKTMNFGSRNHGTPQRAWRLAKRAVVRL